MIFQIKHVQAWIGRIHQLNVMPRVTVQGSRVHWYRPWQLRLTGQGSWLQVEHVMVRQFPVCVVAGLQIPTISHRDLK